MTSDSIPQQTGPGAGAELSPCPFCGDYDPEVAQSAVPTIHGGHKQAVYCNGCFCEGPTADTEADAIAAWNRRAAPERDTPSDDLPVWPKPAAWRWSVPTMAAASSGKEKME